MQEQVIFRDYQAQRAIDHNDLQSSTRASFDTLVADAVTSNRRYAGFGVQKTAQVEVTVAPGRYYDGAGVSGNDHGAVYVKDTATIQNMAGYLASASKRVITISAYGVEQEYDQQARDFLTDAVTRTTQPRVVSMKRGRMAQLVFSPGAENPDPQAPPVPNSQVVIAHVLVDTTQVISVTMVGTNKVASSDEVATRTNQLENWRGQIEPRVSSLGSDLSSLANSVSTFGTRSALQSLSEDMARVKESLRFPANASGYGSDFYLLPKQSDTTNSANLGYDAKVEEGIRFADANADQFEISLFSANDPNASLVDGLLLPRYESERRISTGEYYSDIALGQYGFQTVTQKIGYMSRSRLRYGGTRSVCSNTWAWNTSMGEPAPAGLYDFQTWEIVANDKTWWDPKNPSHEIERYQSYWLDTWKEPYMYAQVQEQVISGALVWQSFLVTNDMWATKLGFYVVQKAANENIRISLCEVQNGVPNLDRVITTINYPHENIVTGWNRPDIHPTFLAKGKRYAIVCMSNANHRLGVASGQSYLDGTFGFSTDGQYYLGDLTKDLMLEVWGARFAAPQVAIEFAPINLDGGFRDLDILAEQWAPSSTQLVFELRLNGSGEWQPLVKDNAAVLAVAPPLAQFRARFIGTRDMMPGIRLTGSRVGVARPKTAFRHVSTEQQTPLTTSITVKALIEGFDETPHDLTCSLRVGANNQAAISVVTKLLDIAAKRYERVWTFTPPATTSFRIVFDGATNSPQNTFHVAERVYYCF